MVKRGHRGHQHGLRIRFDSTVELSMECSDEPLSTSQVESYNRDKLEYDKAMKLVEDAKAGRLPVQIQAAAEAEAAAKAAAAEAEKQQQQQQLQQQQQQQQMQQQQQALAAVITSTEQEAIILGDGTVPMMTVSSMNPVPQQVYKFVNLQGQPLASQWVIRPLMPVMPQQNTQNIPKPAVIQDTPKSAVPDNPGVKRTSTMLGDSNGEYVSPIKKKKDKKHDVENSGTLVPLDEYYYGKKEGDPTYREDKGEYRFKCWYCSKMLYNNVRTMTHMQGHIDSEKQQNLDLTDLTQCRHCYKQFDTPFEMQTHIEKVHMNNANVLMCRICEKDHDSRGALTSHMRQYHNACEMPYICHICHFRSSMYSDVVDHFKKKHDSSESLLCLYCLRVFHVKFVAQGWGMTQSYYHHLLRHQSKTNAKKCSLCKLSFFNSGDVKAHRKKDHAPNQKGVIGINAKYMTPDQVMIRVPEAGLEPKNNSGIKSLNAPSVSKIKEHRGLIFPDSVNEMYCYECKMLMKTQDHYKKYIQCSMCRFATSCSFAYANHMMGFHSGQMTNLALNIPRERTMQMGTMYCLCGFGSKYGNRIANHLVGCSKRSCYKQKPEVIPREEREDEMSDPRKKPGASLLDVLGLVKKPNLASSNFAGSRDEGDDIDSYEIKYNSPPNSPPTLSPISQETFVYDEKNSLPPELTGPKRWDAVKLKDPETPTKKSVFLGALDSPNESMEVTEETSEQSVASNSDQETQNLSNIGETTQKAATVETEPSKDPATEGKEFEESANSREPSPDPPKLDREESDIHAKDVDAESKDPATEGEDSSKDFTTENRAADETSIEDDKKPDDATEGDRLKDITDDAMEGDRLKDITDDAIESDRKLKDLATEGSQESVEASESNKELDTAMDGDSSKAITEDSKKSDEATKGERLKDNTEGSKESIVATEGKKLKDIATESKRELDTAMDGDSLKDITEDSKESDEATEGKRLKDITDDVTESDKKLKDLTTEGSKESDESTECERLKDITEDSKKSDTATEGDILKDLAKEDTKVLKESAAQSKDITQTAASDTSATESIDTAKNAATEGDVSKDTSVGEATTKDLATEGHCVKDIATEGSEDSDISETIFGGKETESISTESLNTEIQDNKNMLDNKKKNESDDGMREASGKDDTDKEQLSEDVDMESSAILKTKNVEVVEISNENILKDPESNVVAQSVPDYQSKSSDQSNDDLTVDNQSFDDIKTDSENTSKESDIKAKTTDEEHKMETGNSAEILEKTEFKTDHSKEDTHESCLGNIKDNDSLNDSEMVSDESAPETNVTDTDVEIENEKESREEKISEREQDLLMDGEMERETGDKSESRINECSDNKSLQSLTDGANVEKIQSDKNVEKIRVDENIHQTEADENMGKTESDETAQQTADESMEKTQPDESMQQIDPDKSMEKTQLNEDMGVEGSTEGKNSEKRVEKTEERILESESQAKTVLPGPSKSSERSLGQSERSLGQGLERSIGQGVERSQGPSQDRSVGQGDEMSKSHGHERLEGQGERSQDQGHERSESQGDRSKSHSGDRSLHRDKSSRDRDDCSDERDRKRDRDRDRDRYDHHRSDRDRDRDYRHDHDRRDDREWRDNRDRSWNRHQDYHSSHRGDRGHSQNYQRGNKDYHRDHQGQHRDRHGYGGYQDNRDYRGGRGRGRGYQGGGYRGSYY